MVGCHRPPNETLGKVLVLKSGPRSLAAGAARGIQSEFRFIVDYTVLFKTVIRGRGSREGELSKKCGLALQHGGGNPNWVATTPGLTKRQGCNSRTRGS